MNLLWLHPLGLVFQVMDKKDIRWGMEILAVVDQEIITGI